MADAFGSITWWGFSPALDFQELDINSALNEINFENKEHGDLNILVVGAGDSRHLLKTMAHAYRHPKRTINFYIVESHIDLYARHLLFLAIAFEPQARMGLQEKTELYLELFGNSLVRRQCMDYVEKMATEFIKMVTNSDYLEKKVPMIDLSLLKYKERDMLEAIFKFWRQPDKDKTTFDVDKCWDLRLRQYLGVRYDAIPNVFDWDYSMKLTYKDASIINSNDYRQWRHYGVAFGIREGTYDVPNRTVASGHVFNVQGDRFVRRGYWGDIIASPYICYGIECEEKSFFKMANNHHVKSAQDVSEYNVLSMLHELMHRTKYELPEPEAESKAEKEKPQQATLTEITEEDEEKSAEIEDDRKQDGEEEGKTSGDGRNSGGVPEDSQKMTDVEYKAIDAPNIKIHFLPLNSLIEMHKKSKYQRLFNSVYMSNSLVHLLTLDLSKTFADKALLTLETCKFMLELKNEQSKEFVKKITGMAEDVGCKILKPCDVEKDTFARFVFTQNNSSST
ncbi:Dynein assembly factor 3, axonemal [Lamellibrachia satsuma]|nr:Dynein assembly factor 3, axonemal [Lamellibrachia satsuma]